MLLRSSLVLCLLLSPGAALAEWPGWRGPAANTVAPPGDYPVDFGADRNLAWKADLPGEGSSTPTWWGDAIFLTATAENRDLLVCYGTDGVERWRRDIDQATQAKNRSATGGNPSTVVDAQHVVAYFKSGALACFTHSGQELWRVNLQEKYGQDTLWWDLGTSPVVSSAGVVVAVMQAGESYLVTLDLDSGQVVWKQDRVYERPRESDQAYTTPAVLSVDGTETIVTWGADHLTGHDAKTGKLLWDCGGFNPENQGMWRVIASATIQNGVAYVPYGRGNFFAAVKLGGSGDITGQARLWEATGVGADVPSPVVHEGKVYVLGDRGRGQLDVLDARSGDQLSTLRLPRSRSNFFSTPLLAAGRLYCTRENGDVVVLSVTDGLRVVAQNSLDEETVATPVPLGDSLLFRTRSSLFCFANGAPEVSKQAAAE
ncbi:MAG: PQQ-binding-like beta-propeller repeat protein [Planctomycetales bacterium]|nr:PQQ-binding-like beta-propeller repeat protein [Planctomycetales bacterium]